MWHLLHLVVAPAEFLLGLFCLLTAIVLYPGEEGQIQSKFEDFWVRVDDYQQLALSRHAAFMTQVAKLETRFLDRVFGSKLISSRAVGVSVCCSLGTPLVLLLVLIMLGTGLILLVPLMLLSCFLLVLGSAGFLQKRTILRRGLRAIAFTLLALCLGLLLAMAYGYLRTGSLSMLVLVMLLVVLGGFSCDVLFIALTRRLVRWAGEMTSSLKVFATVVVNLLLALLLVGLPMPMFYLSKHFEGRRVSEIVSGVYGIAVIIACTNIFDVVLVLLFILLATILLIHRALWPLLTRTLFRMQDIGTKGRRGILMTAGLALLGWSGVKLPEVVKELLKGLGNG